MQTRHAAAPLLRALAASVVAATLTLSLGSCGRPEESPIVGYLPAAGGVEIVLRVSVKDENQSVESSVLEQTSTVVKVKVELGELAGDPVAGNERLNDVTVRLQAPLGNRSVQDEDGTPLKQL